MEQLSFVPEPPGTLTVTLEGREVRATSPEGVTAELPLTEILQLANPPRLDARECILPDGVKSLVPTPVGAIVVHQTPPHVASLRWIAADSPARWGEGTVYRDVRVSLPYVIVVAVFDEGPDGIPVLGQRNECYFSREPLDGKGFETPLDYPALLNCSRFPDNRQAPLSWICTQHLPRSAVSGLPDLASSVRAGVSQLLRHLFESGFNYSSEDHELSSWYTATVEATSDPRFESVEAWEAATRVDPLFALDFEWLPTGRTLRDITKRISEQHSQRISRRRRSIETASDVAHIVLGPSNARLRRRRRTS